VEFLNALKENKHKHAREARHVRRNSSFQSAVNSIHAVNTRTAPHGAVLGQPLIAGQTVLLSNEKPAKSGKTTRAGSCQMNKTKNNIPPPVGRVR